jgi:hypothetical protein
VLIARAGGRLVPRLAVTTAILAPLMNLGRDAPRGYIERFVGAVQGADWSDAERAKGEVVEAMGAYLQTSDLRSLMEPSIEPVATQPPAQAESLIGSARVSFAGRQRPPTA